MGEEGSEGVWEVQKHKGCDRNPGPRSSSATDLLLATRHRPRPEMGLRVPSLTCKL